MDGSLTNPMCQHAREAAAVPFRAIQQASVDLMFCDALVEEVTELGPEVAAACSALQETIKERQSAVLQAAAGKLVWDEIPRLPEDPQVGLAEITHRLQEQANAFDATADEKLKAAMVTARTELDARRRLAEVKAAVLEAMTKHELCRKLQVCIDDLEARGISRKSTDALAYDGQPGAGRCPQR
jgi:phospholipase/lecithinase/hemolysin